MMKLKVKGSLVLATFLAGCSAATFCPPEKPTAGFVPGRVACSAINPADIHLYLSCTKPGAPKNAMAENVACIHLTAPIDERFHGYCPAPVPVDDRKNPGVDPVDPVDPEQPAIGDTNAAAGGVGSTTASSRQEGGVTTTTVSSSSSYADTLTNRGTSVTVHGVTSSASPNTGVSLSR